MNNLGAQFADGVARQFFLYFVWLVHFSVCCGCGDHIFEAVSSGTTVSDSESAQSVDTDDEDISWRAVPQGIPECAPYEPSITSIDEGDTDLNETANIVIGDGTRAECGYLELQDAFSVINEKRSGSIRFNCGSAVNRILLTEPLEIKAGVRLHFDGGMTTVLDGRNTFRILNAHEGSEIVFEKTIFLDGEVDGTARGNDNDNDNDNGGAIFINNSTSSGSAVFSECVFKDNLSAKGRGGAIFANRLDRLDISRCVFEGNAAASAGALFFLGSKFLLSNTLVFGNQVYRDGGGFVVVEDELDTDSEQFVYCGAQFSNNLSEGDGSALKISQSSNSKSLILNSEFVQNNISVESTPTDGAGAVYLRGGEALLESVSFIRNSSTSGSVAGLYLNTVKGFEATNCTFFANESTEGKGGAIFQNDSNSGLIRNCTFAQNSAQLGGAIFREQGEGLEIYNSIFVDNYVEGGLPGSCNQTFAGRDNFQWANGFESLSRVCTTGTKLENVFLGLPLYNGGFVMTCSLDLLSSARDVSENCPNSDARGFVRSKPCDAGAYEVIEK